MMNQMPRVFYEVEATFQDEKTAREWVDWMLGGHLADVVRAGAQSGRLVRLGDSPLHYAAHYEFADRPAFETYIREHAPRLREEGLRRFGSDFVSYQRRDGDIIG